MTEVYFPDKNIMGRLSRKKEHVQSHMLRNIIVYLGNFTFSCGVYCQNFALISVFTKKINNTGNDFQLATKEDDLVVIIEFILVMK